MLTWIKLMALFSRDNPFSLDALPQDISDPDMIQSLAHNILSYFTIPAFDNNPLFQNTDLHHDDPMTNDDDYKLRSKKTFFVTSDDTPDVFAIQAKNYNGHAMFTVYPYGEPHKLVLSFDDSRNPSFVTNMDWVDLEGDDMIHIMMFQYRQEGHSRQLEQTARGPHKISPKTCDIN